MSFKNEVFDLLDGVNTTEFLNKSLDQMGGNYRNPIPGRPPHYQSGRVPMKPITPMRPRGQPVTTPVENETNTPTSKGVPSWLIWVVIAIFIICCICCLISSSIGIAFRDDISDAIGGNEGFNPNLKNNEKKRSRLRR